jgi:hypothetical protein
MNPQRAYWVPMLELVILGVILLAIFALGVMIFIGLPLIHMPATQRPARLDTLNLVDAFHSAVNDENTDAVLALLSENATINDGGDIVQGRKEIRNWVLNSKYMAGLHIKLIESHVTGQKVFWQDLARNGTEAQARIYVLRWMADIQNGKINSLTVSSQPMPDGK